MYKILRNIIFVFLTILILLFVGVFFLFKNFESKYFSEIESKNGKTNFLILGINGGTSIDADLTDTIIFTSIDRTSKNIKLISIPRDLWIEGIKTKINSAYHFGGIDLTKETVQKVIGQDINYSLVFNFESLKNIVDYFGGISVDVKNSFDDDKYPIAGKEKDLCNGDWNFACRYEHLHFEKGVQLMNGETALKFSRSRNAIGQEGSDFARSQRQMQIIMAIKKQASDFSWYLKEKKNPLDLLKIIQNEVKTDIRENQYGNLLMLLKNLDLNSIKTVTIDESVIVHPKYHYSRQWVLLPKEKDYGDIKKFVEDQLK